MRQETVQAEILEGLDGDAMCPQGFLVAEMGSPS